MLLVFRCNYCIFHNTYSHNLPTPVCTYDLPMCGVGFFRKNFQKNFRKIQKNSRDPEKRKKLRGTIPKVRFNKPDINNPDINKPRY